MRGKSESAGVEQLHQVVLDLDVVVGARQAEPGGALQRAARRIVQLPDQRLQVEGHISS